MTKQNGVKTGWKWGKNWAVQGKNGVKVGVTTRRSCGCAHTVLAVTAPLFRRGCHFGWATAVLEGRQWHDRRSMRGAFGMIVVPEPTMFGVGSSSDPVCPELAMSSPLLSEGIVVSEATAILEAQWWHDRRAVPSGWSMAPDPSYLSSLRGLAISNSQGCGHNLWVAPCRLALRAYGWRRVAARRP